jgi:hypothetical protein
MKQILSINLCSIFHNKFLALVEACLILFRIFFLVNLFYFNFLDY